jgi:hypothetical protein
MFHIEIGLDFFHYHSLAYKMVFRENLASIFMLSYTLVEYHVCPSSPWSGSSPTSVDPLPLGDDVELDVDVGLDDEVGLEDDIDIEDDDDDDEEDDDECLWRRIRMFPRSLRLLCRT